MLRRVDITASNRVIVYIRDLLPQHAVILHELRVRSFLPDLVFACGLVFLLEIGELVEQPSLARRLGPVDDLTGCMPLEGLHHAHEVRGLHREVQVVLHYYVSVQAKPFGLAAVCQGFGEYPARFVAIEDGYPLDDRGCQEVDAVGVVDALSRAHVGRLCEA